MFTTCGNLRRARSLGYLIAFLAAVGTAALAQAPRTLSVSGVLTNAAGTPKANGSYTLTFRLFDAATGGTALWTEANKPVTVAGGEGAFTTRLGSATPLSLPFDKPYFLEVQAQGEAAPMTPRLALSAAPYALGGGSASLSLPFSGSTSVATPGTALKVTNTGSGLGIVAEAPSHVGVQGVSDTWVGVWGNSRTSSGVHGQSDSWVGTSGRSNTGSGVYGESTHWSGVWGQSVNSTGVVGKSDKWVGVYGESAADKGVHGVSPNWVGVWGSSTKSTGVRGESTSGWGVQGQSGSNTGVLGESSTGWGVHGKSGTQAGVRGESSTGFGVEGFSPAYIGISGSSNSSFGVKGHSANPDSVGVYGSTAYGNFGALAATFQESPSITARAGVLAVGGPLGANVTYGLYAQGGATAARFVGNVFVSGNLGASSKSFRIDHPADPANKTLTYTCTEGPEPLDLYSGNATTDEDGSAVVHLPDHFEALNRDFRYQLTPIGQFAQAIIAEKIRDNRFTIRTDKPNVEVSWQVTGVRNDAYTRANQPPVEELKPLHERGRYLNPEAYGQPAERGIGRIAADALRPEGR